MRQDGSENPLLAIRNLTLKYRGKAGSPTILSDVSLTVRRGEILGLIGESGAGKSTLGNAVLGLLPPEFEQTAGEIKFDGHLLNAMSEPQRHAMRGRNISAIFQDPTASLDPLMPIGAQLEETILVSGALSRKQARARAIELLGRVGIPDPSERYRDYPHQFSGGQRQRIVIAIALAGTPDLIVADEPTSALDATVQKQILRLLRDLVDETGISVILVTHDMGVISEIADRVAVMRHGEIVEQGRTSDILDAPRQNYTRSLLAAVPLLQIPNPFGLADLVEKIAGRPVEKPAAEDEAAAPILIAHGITKTFSRRALPWLGRGTGKAALQDVSIRLRRGEVTGIVGESGSGKSTIARILAGLETANQGKLNLDGMGFDIALGGSRSGLLGQVQMIFQDPSASLNPRMSIGDTLVESVRFSVPGARHDRPDVGAMMDRLGLARSLLSRYPHQLSGGQKQRVCIARALLTGARIIVADEPTSALDVSVQAEIVTLLKESVAERGVSMLFISHDLALVQQLCSWVYIFREGRVEDEGSSGFIFARSDNPYTRSLIDARPERFTLNAGALRAV